MVLVPQLGLLTSTLVYRLQYQHGEGLVNLVKLVSDVPGHWVDEWKSGTFPENCKYSECATDHNHGVNEQLTSGQSWQRFSGSESWVTYSCTEG